MAKPKGAPRSAHGNTPRHDTHMPSLSARIDKLVDHEGNNLKAFASVTIGGAFTIHGLNVMDSQNGLFVSMPSTKYEKNGQTQYSENFHAVTKGARDELSRVVLDAYEQSMYMNRYMSQDLGDLEPGLPFGQSM